MSSDTNPTPDTPESAETTKAAEAAEATESAESAESAESVALIRELEAAGVELWEDNGRIRFRAPRGALTEARKEALRADRDGVIAALRKAAIPVSAVPDPQSRYDPFPLTDVQSAYLLGRYDAFGLGGVGCHSYSEVHYPTLDPGRTEDAWNRLIARHDMLRCVLSTDGHQQVLPEVARYRIAVDDLRGRSPEERLRALGATRAELDHRMADPAAWPLFELRITRTDDEDILHVSFDSLIADWSSAALLMHELETLVADPAAELPTPAITFRDYVLAERELRDGARHQRDRDYWFGRVDDLPSAPDLGYLDRDGGEARFARHHRRLPRAQWRVLCEAAGRHGLTPTAAVLSAYAVVLQRWSGNSRFTLDLTLLNRLDLHPDVGLVVGDFTSVSLLAVERPGRSSFAEYAAAVQAQLAEDLNHRLCSGVEVLREVARRRGREAARMPVVFTSGIGAGPPASATSGRQGEGLTQTPQVALDCQVADDEEGLRIDLDTRVGALPDGLVPDLADALLDLLSRLVEEEIWAGRVSSAELVPLPTWQRAERAEANRTSAPIEARPLHAAVLEQARRAPGAPAVITSAGEMTYADLLGWAGAVAEQLRCAGVGRGDRVAVIMDKGAEQVAAVLGVLLMGGTYLPIDTTSPAPRRRHMMAAARASAVLTQEWVDPGVDAAIRLVVSRPDRVPGLQEVVEDSCRTDPAELAYIIFTSGSSGVPKGVMITHAAAWNTVADINARFAMGPADRVLGLAQLGFDLSVFDIFGPLSAGGTLVLPEAGRRSDPSHWATLITEHRVTVWNSVPAQMQMLVEYCGHGARESGAPTTLRLVLLSGDWIPVTLPDRVRDLTRGATVVSLGGATEAAIWSIHHVIDDPVLADWASVPYGRPLTNQAFRVVDDEGRDAPVWMAGELCITGSGLARGYLEDPGLTAERFPRLLGRRCYRTGDVGRYLPGGEIEFLGRRDSQVKVRGHRVELGEIEATLLAVPGVGAAAVTVATGATGSRILLGFVEPERRSIDAEALGAYARRVSRTVERTLPAPEAHGGPRTSGPAVERDGSDADATARWLDRVVAVAAHRAVSDQVARDEPSPVRIIEIGGGTGTMAEAVLPVLAGFDVDYLLTDVSPRLLEGAAARLPPNARSARLDIAGDLREQGYGPAIADIVISTGALGLCDDPAAAARRALSLLRPGGILILTEPASPHGEGGDADGSGGGAGVPGRSPLSPGAWRRLLTDAGSEVVVEPAVPEGVGAAVLVAVAGADRAPLWADALLAHLREKLPAYMVPERLQIVERLPLTANGKVDRSALVSWDPAQVAETGTGRPADELERRLARLWSGLLGVERIGRQESLFELGADSLIIARAAGRLREEVPEAGEFEFDVLLRLMLNEPTLEALAGLLRAGPTTRNVRRETAGALARVPDPRAGARAEGSNALLVPFGGEGGDGPLRVIFHAALGTLDTFQALGGLLVEQGLGPVIGIAVADWDDYCAVEPAELISRLADDYTDRLLSRSSARFQLIGHSLGGLLAVEVARRMLESGVPVADLTLIDSVPTLVSTDDELALEAVFVPNLKLDPGEVVLGGVDSADVFRAFMMVHDRNDGHVPDGALSRVGGDPGLDAVAAAFRERAAIPQEERLAAYARASEARAGAPVEPELVPALYQVFRHSLLGSVVRLDPYLGDLTLLHASQRQSFGIIPGMEGLSVPYWTDTCLGELTVIDIEGHHLSCIEEPHVTRVADLLGRAVRGRR